MVKYRLIETYPGSLPLGTISKIDYSRYPKNWEEFIEEDSVILSFIYKSGSVVTLRERGVYIIDSAEDSDYKGFTLAEQKRDRFSEIHSVKRLSDGEIFTLGDNVCKVSNNLFTISSFNISSKGETYASCLGDLYSPSIAMRELQKVIEPLFKTEDGVDVFSKSKSYYVVTNDFTIAYCSVFSKKDLEYKLFSTQKAARNYVKMNKPEFSRKQILELLDNLKK